ncbi:MAG: hypothetical protein MJZ37_06570 [Bacilli bacterium]|nr:hypothetical protein [Bacilli bacterium]
MKNKLLKLAIFAMSFGLVGCDAFPFLPSLPGGPNQPGNKFDDIDENGEVLGENNDYRYNKEYHWKYNEEEKYTGTKEYHVFKKTHKDSTCLENGYDRKVCEVCNYTEESHYDLSNHDFEIIEEESIFPSCLNTVGYVESKCKVCGVHNIEEVFWNGEHNYIDPATKEFNIIMDKEATCSEEGYGRKICVDCGHSIQFFSPPLSHNFNDKFDLFGAVRVLTCSRCGEKHLSFNMEEITDASKETLLYDNNNEGARFYGHSIGNDTPLGTDGNLNSPVDPVFSIFQEGDNVELFFYLSEEDADYYKDARLIVDAKPADYMFNNRVDFFLSQDKNTSDWYPGFYIKDEGGHTKGDRVEDARYLLYVDNVLQEFDPTVVNVPENNKRQDFVVPYTFNFEPGYHYVKLVMAGGYKSTFYGFRFEADYDYQQHEMNNSHEFRVASTDYPNESGVKCVKEECNCGAVKFTVDVDSDLNGNLHRNGKLLKSYSGIYDESLVSRFIFTVDDFYVGKLYAYGGIDNQYIFDNSYSFYSGKVDGVTYSILPDNQTNTSLKVNGYPIPLSNKKYNENEGISGVIREKLNSETGDTIYINAGLIEMGNISLVRGENAIDLAALNSYGIVYVDLVFIGRSVNR